MQAWQVVRHGDPVSALELRDVAVPTPGPGQLLVRVNATALNYPDVMLAAGTYQLRPELPFTAGIELCGTVVAAGEPAVGFSTGDRVIGTPALPHGALADYALMPVATSALAPSALDDAQASALYVAYQTGWFGLHRRARLQPGETLLVHAATGGVGSAAVQLGTAAGARVVAVVCGPAKAELAWELGADAVVDRTACPDVDALTAALKQACGPAGADVVYDPVGGDSYLASTKVVAFEGRIVVVGFTSGVVPKVAANHILIKNYSVLGLHWGLYHQQDPDAVQQAQRELTELADAGLVDPLVPERVAMADVPDALTRLGAGGTTGRVVVLR